MTLYSERVRSDQVHQTLANLKAVIGTSRKDLPDLIPAAVERFDRFEAVMDRFETAVAGADPLLVPMTMLTSARSLLDQAAAEINNFRASRNEGYLDNASNHLDGLLGYAAAMQPVRTSSGLQRLSRSIGKAREAADKAARESEAKLQALAQRAGDAEARLSEVVAEIGRQTTLLATESASQQAQFREMQAKWDQVLRDATKSQEDRVSAFLVQTTDHLNTASTQQQQKLQDLLVEAREDLREGAETFGNEAKALVEEMEGFRDQASRILELVGASGVIGGYKQEADRSRKAALLAHGGALISLLVLAWLAWTVLQPATQGEGWLGFAARALLFAILAAPATYFGRQAIRYDRSERANRRLELELSSVRPFIADLDMESQKQVKLKLVDRLYAQPDTRDSASPPVLPSAEVLRGLLNQMTKEEKGRPA